MTTLSAAEIAIVLHTLGLHTLGPGSSGQKSYRNHFVAGPGHHDMPTLESLVSKGIMYQGNTPGFLGRSDAVFYINDEWIDKAEAYVKKIKADEEAKLTRSQRRYRRYLESDGVFNAFRDFLRYETQTTRRAALAEGEKSRG